jgi:hypothetical protein
MTGFADGLQQFAKKAGKLPTAVFVTTVTEMRESIRFGSAVTGAPPMPVSPPTITRWGKVKVLKSGALRDSVVATYTDPEHAVIYTTKWYAPDVEDNTASHVFNSGGPHGWKLTAAAFTKLVELNAKRLGGK